MLEELEKLCRLCGRFRDGHFVPRALRPALTEAKVSPTWVKLYEQWRLRRAVSGTSGRSDSGDAQGMDATPQPGDRSS